MPLYSIGQNLCGYNAGFDDNSFNAWSGDTGDNNTDPLTGFPILTTTWIGIDTSKGFWGSNQMIMRTPANDPNTCNTVPEICPWGSPYSARLGNSVPFCHNEGLYYRMTVNPAQPILVYAFAPVLQDPNHPDYAQPAFTCYVKSSIGSTIPCTYYRATATNLRGTSSCPDPFQGIQNVYRNWRNVAIDLSAYAGQQVTVVYKTNDCNWCGHWGYAYLDIIGCYPKQITIDRCTGTGSMTLTAPPGFETYLWSTGQTTQSITINPQTAPSYISVTFTSANGCSTTIGTNITNIDPIPAFTGLGGCICRSGNIVRFFDLSTYSSTPIRSWLWNFGDGTTSTQQNPVHTYATSGTYVVTLTIAYNSICSWTTQRTITIAPCPTISPISHN